MLGFQIPAFNRFRNFLIQRFAFQIIIDIFVGHAQRHFVRQGGAVVLKIGGRQLFIQMLRAA